MKMGGRWQKFPGMVGEKQMINLRNMFNEEGLKTLQDVKYDGDDTVDDQAAHVYSYRNSQVNANMPYPFTSKIWVGANDGLPKKIDVTYEGGDLKTMTIIYDYSSNISVDPPV